MRAKCVCVCVWIACQPSETSLLRRWLGNKWLWPPVTFKTAQHVCECASVCLFLSVWVHLCLAIPWGLQPSETIQLHGNQVEFTTMTHMKSHVHFQVNMDSGGNQTHNLWLVYSVQTFICLMILNKHWINNPERFSQSSMRTIRNSVRESDEFPLTDTYDALPSITCEWD